MAFIILGLYRNMGNGASAAADKAGRGVMEQRQQQRGMILQRQGQRPPPSSMTMRSGKKTANKLLSFDTMNSGLQSTINALIQKDGGTSKNFVLLEFKNGIQRNKALIDQLELFNRLILDPDVNEVAAQREKRKNFNNSRSVNRVGIWTGAENKQFPAVALQSIVGRYPGLFRQFFRENGTAYDSLLRVASASNEYNFWKYDGSRNIRMNDRGEFDTIVLLCVISPNNDTTYDLDRDNLESRDTRNRNSLYEGLLYAKDKTFRMLAYKTKGKDGDLSRLPVGRSRPLTGEDGSRASSPTSQSSEEAGQGISTEWGTERMRQATEEAAEEVAFNRARTLFAEEEAPAEELRMSPAAAAARAAEKRLAIAQVKKKINEGKSWKFSEVPNKDPEIIEMLRKYNKDVKNRARSAAEVAPDGGDSEKAVEQGVKSLLFYKNIIYNYIDLIITNDKDYVIDNKVTLIKKLTQIKPILNSYETMTDPRVVKEKKRANIYYNILEGLVNVGMSTDVNRGSAIQKMEPILDEYKQNTEEYYGGIGDDQILFIKNINKYLTDMNTPAGEAGRAALARLRPKGGSRRTKKRKIECTRRRNKKHGR